MDEDGVQLNSYAVTFFNIDTFPISPLSHNFNFLNNLFEKIF